MGRLGKNIKKIRQKWDMDQEEFGALLNVSKSAVSMYETGNNEPKIPFLVLLCKWSNVDIQTMYEEEILDKDIPAQPLMTKRDVTTKEPKIKYHPIEEDLLNYPKLVATVRSLLERVDKLEEE